MPFTQGIQAKCRHKRRYRQNVTRNDAGLLARCEPHTPTHNSNVNNAHVAHTPTHNQGLALAYNEAKAIY